MAAFAGRLPALPSSTKGSPAPCATTTLPAPQRRGRGKSRFDDDETPFLNVGGTGPYRPEDEPEPRARGPLVLLGPRRVHGPEPYPHWLVTELAAR